MRKVTIRLFYLFFSIGFVIILFVSAPALLSSWVAIVAVPLVIGILVLCWVLIKKLSAKASRIAAAALIALWLVAVFLFACSVRVFPAWDFGSNHEAALHLYENHAFVSPVIREYYLRHIHNLCPMLVLTAWYFITLPLGMDSVVSGILLNVLLMGVAQVFLYLAARRWRGPRFGLFTLFICCCSAPFILYSPIFYTDTFGLPFAAIALYCFVRLIKASAAGKARAKWAIFTGLALFGGYMMKATVLILAVAMALMLLLKQRKKAVIPLVSLAGALILPIAGWNVVLNSNILINYDDASIYKFPAYHYIMMGLEGNGGYNPQDEQYSMQFPDLESRTAGEKALIGERLKDYGVSGLLLHTAEKIEYTWADGTYFAPNKLVQNTQTESFLHQFILPTGQYYAYFASVLNAQHFYLLLGFVLLSLRGLLKKRPRADLGFLCLMAVFGLALFLMVWETRSRYIVVFAPLYAVLLALMTVRLQRGLAMLKRRLFGKKAALPKGSQGL